MDRMRLKDGAAAVLEPLEKWAKQCHAASYELVKAGLADRVARGTHPAVGSQHSWAVRGMDCYDPEALILDPVLWSYTGGRPFVFVCQLKELGHRPHGQGNIWEYGRPAERTDAAISLTPSEPLTPAAAAFLDVLGPLDRKGWSTLVNSPVGGWPAGDILAAVDDTEELRALIPIDRLGMLTDRNPGEMYLRTEPPAPSRSGGVG